MVIKGVQVVPYHKDAESEADVKSENESEDDDDSEVDEILKSQPHKKKVARAKDFKSAPF